MHVIVKTIMYCDILIARTISGIVYNAAPTCNGSLFLLWVLIKLVGRDKRGVPERLWQAVLTGNSQMKDAQAESGVGPLFFCKMKSTLRQVWIAVWRG